MKTKLFLAAISSIAVFATTSCQNTASTADNPYGAPAAAPLQTPATNPYAAPTAPQAGTYNPNGAPYQPLPGLPPQSSAPQAPPIQSTPTYNPVPSTPTYNNTATGGSHTVVSGDSLWGLARKYNTSVESIQTANGLTDTVIRTGQTLTIPGQ